MRYPRVGARVRGNLRGTFMRKNELQFWSRVREGAFVERKRETDKGQRPKGLCVVVVARLFRENRSAMRRRRKVISSAGPGSLFGLDGKA